MPHILNMHIFGTDGSVLCQPEDLFVENKEVNLKDVL